MVTRARDCQNRQRICDPALAYRVCKASIPGALVHVHLQAALALSMQHKSALKHVRTGNTLMQAGWHYPIAQAHRATKQRYFHTRVAPHKRPAVGYRELHPCASLAMQTVVPGRIAIQVRLIRTLRTTPRLIVSVLVGPHARHPTWGGQWKNKSKRVQLPPARRRR